MGLLPGNLSARGRTRFPCGVSMKCLFTIERRVRRKSVALVNEKLDSPAYDEEPISPSSVETDESPDHGFFPMT